MKQIKVISTISTAQMLDLLNGWGFTVKESHDELRVYKNGKYEGIAETIFWSRYSDWLQEMANRQGSVQ